MAETPSAMPYPGNIVSARTARHRRHTSAKTGNPQNEWYFVVGMLWPLRLSRSLVHQHGLPAAQP